MALAGQRCVNEPKQSRFSPTGSSVTFIIPFFLCFFFFGLWIQHVLSTAADVPNTSLRLHLRLASAVTLGFAFMTRDRRES